MWRRGGVRAVYSAYVCSDRVLYLWCNQIEPIPGMYSVLLIYIGKNESRMAGIILVYAKSSVV